MVLHPQIVFLLLGLTSLLVPPCAPFYPNRESLGAIEAQFTDEEITEQGVLRAVAMFMERHPLPNHGPFAPGQLENLSPLTPTSLFQAYYGGPISAERFSQAIQEIGIGNNFIEQMYEDSEEYFFYCDSFQKANQVIIIKRASIIHDLMNNPNDYEAINNALMKIGELLHIIQKFYSNSNWLEMGQTQPYSGLGRDDVAFSPIVTPAKTTCVPCPKKNGVYTCQDNLVEKKLLTSGYRKVGLCINKPQGKCNHGGINDTWQDKAPAGGINKETNDARVSPHHMWHKAAGQQAVLATRDFFISNNGGLLESVGEFMFRTLFSMNGYSLAFVIDVSASMGDDIEAIRNTCFDILDKHKNSLNAPFNYILVPFNDPDVGPVMETKNVSVLKAAIDDLKPDGGGDCPEMALTGLELALKNSLPRSHIFVFSDASAKDEEKRDSVNTLTEQTKSKIGFYLTGTCAEGRRKRDNNGYAHGVSNVRKARVRRSNGTNIFHELSQLSGGSYVMTTKKELGILLKDVELTMNSAPVTVLQKRVTSGQLLVPIDQALLDFAISVKSENPFTLSLLRPDGSPVTDGENIVDTPTYKVLLIRKPSPQGNWDVVTEGTAPRDVIVTGKSIQDFSYQIMHDKNGFVLPIQGRPVADKEYTLQVKPSGGNGNFSIDEVLILNVQGSILQRFSAQPLPGSLSGMTSVRARFTSLEPMMVGVCGTTARTEKYCRLQTQLVFIEKIRLSRLRGETTMMKPGESINISIVLSNDGASDHFIINVKDQMNLLTTYSPHTISLDQGHNITIVSTFSAPAEFNSYTSSLVRVVVKTPRRGTGETYNYLTFAVTTIPQNAFVVDTEPPNVNFTGSPAICKEEHKHEENCSTYPWELHFESQDEQSKANLSVTVTLGNQTGVNTWKEGDVMVGQYRSSCCFPYVEIKISDMSGNIQEISLYNYKAPTASLPTDEISGPMIVIIGSCVGVAAVLLACVVGLVMHCSKKK
uniref:von Willebrand factor A domain-containing protein 7-like n=1 Tax=Myxine glutinosa TaxID=7769 RepID=UPI00358EB2F4